jgi:hypothetical protein
MPMGLDKKRKSAMTLEQEGRSTTGTWRNAERSAQSTRKHASLNTGICPVGEQSEEGKTQNTPSPFFPFLFYSFTILCFLTPYHLP